MAFRTVCPQRSRADIKCTDPRPLATSGESGKLQDGAASGQVTARARSAQEASDQRHFRRRGADGGWNGVLDSHLVDQSSSQRERRPRTTRSRRQRVAGGTGICHSTQGRHEGSLGRKYWRTNYGNWVRFRPPAPREVAAQAAEVAHCVETGADKVVDAGVEQRGGDPQPPQEMAKHNSCIAMKKTGTDGCTARKALEASLAAAVASGYVCALCVHRKVGCGCPQYEAKMAALIANRRRETTGDNICKIGMMLVIALAAGVWLFQQFPS